MTSASPHLGRLLLEGLISGEIATDPSWLERRDGRPCVVGTPTFEVDLTGDRPVARLTIRHGGRAVVGYEWELPPGGTLAVDFRLGGRMSVPIELE